MKQGINRFNYFLTQLETIILAAGKQKNPALWLYRNNARTPLFMLESLAKLYAEFHNEKLFSRLKEHFKLLEDALGAIDYYDTIAKDFAANKKVPAPVINYLQAQTREKIQSLNEVLTEKEWLKADVLRISKIHKKLERADWKNEEKEMALIKDFYGEAIYGIVEFVRETNFKFSDMESEVHELRRKMRWLSIYPQALRGAIQLKAAVRRPRHLTKYCTEEITGSAFNIMPDPGNLSVLLFLEKNHFYALSWMIDRLGYFKDSGLRIVALQEALQQTTSVSNEEAAVRVEQMLGKQQPSLKELLSAAGTTCKTYFKEQNLEHLVIGITKVADK